ncbi:MAG: YwiC-like family protein [Chloroflexota bacterium]
MMLPREHGAWAMLLIPYFLGTVASGWGGWSSTLMLISIIALFTSVRPLEILLLGGNKPATAAPLVADNVRDKRCHLRKTQAILWLAIFWGIGGTSTIILLQAYQRWQLAPLGVIAGIALVAALSFRRRSRWDRSWPVRLLYIAALSLSGPAAYYAASGDFSRPAFAVWFLAFLYSGASLFYVRLLTRSAHQQPGKQAKRVTNAGVARQLGLYLALATLSLATLTHFDWLPPLAGLAFIPLIVKLLWVPWRRNYRPTLKEIGIAEVGHAAIFTVLAAFALTNWVSGMGLG